MNRLKIIVAVVGMVIGGAACRRSEISFPPAATEEELAVRALQRLQLADAAQDADAAVARRDYRLVAVALFVPVIPAGEPVPERYVKGLCSHRAIPFTSDSGGEAVWRLNAYAEEYARRYNERLLERMGVETVCPSEPGVAAENATSAVIVEIESANPTRDANVAIAERDYRIVVFGGKKARAPGPVALAQAFFAGRCGFRTFDYTNLENPTPTEVKLNTLVERYAAVYNGRLVEQVGLARICKDR